MRDLPHLAARLYDTPLMIARPKLETIVTAIGGRLLGLDDVLQSPMPANHPRPTVVDGIGVLPIMGTLVKRSAYLGAASGLMGYEEIEAGAERLFADSNVAAVVLSLDSPGGEVGGLFDVAARLRQLADETQKPLYAIADEAALSAAYAIACAADEIWTTQTAEVGSIGVIAVHLDQSARDAQDGFAYTFIAAGAHKLDGNPHQPLSEAARADIEADVADLYTRFVAWVAARRGLSERAVQQTEAAIYRGEAAVRAGLADRVGTLRDLVESASIHVNKRSMTMTMTESTSVSVAAVEETASQPDWPQSPTAATVAAEIASAALEIAEQARVLGVDIDAAAAIRQGLSLDELRRDVLARAAKAAASRDIVAHAPHPADAGAASPLVAAMRAKYGK